MTDRTKSFRCASGHETSRPGFCPECGAPVEAVAIETCPDCGTARADGARYCEACRYDFRSVDPAPPQAPPLCVAVQVDPSLVAEPDPDNPCPVGRSEELYELDLDETLVGRRSDAPEALAEIEIADSGVSRRHLSFLRRADGGYAVLDLNSTNGTWLNDVELRAGVETPIGPGDELTIGEWTRLTIRVR
jgi:hypothetical protein